MLENIRIGFALTGSFCTYAAIFKELKNIEAVGAKITTIFSNTAMHTSCRFGSSEEFIKNAIEITGNSPITSIVEAEPVGPKNLFDILVIAPCTGNTLAKLTNGITDSPVLMATKSHLRNNKPVVISLASNDSLSMNLKNIGTLINIKNIYFVPFGQDNYKAKPNSMIAHTDLIIPTIEKALEGIQIQPIIQSPF